MVVCFYKLNSVQSYYINKTILLHHRNKWNGVDKTIKSSLRALKYGTVLAFLLFLNDKYLQSFRIEPHSMLKEYECGYIMESVLLKNGK